MVLCGLTFKSIILDPKEKCKALWSGKQAPQKLTNFQINLAAEPCDVGICIRSLSP